MLVNTSESCLLDWYFQFLLGGVSNLLLRFRPKDYRTSVSLLTMTSDLDTVFIRHRISSTSGAIEDLYRDDLIGVHYSNTPITADPEECAARYEETGKENHRKLGNKIDVLKNWAKSGALVGADYGASSQALKGGMKIGAVRPPNHDSQTHLLLIGCRGSECVGFIEVPFGTSESEILTRAEEASNSLFELFDNVEDIDDGYVYTGLQLEDSRWVWYRDYPVLSAKLPRGALGTWDDGDMKYLRAAYSGATTLTEILGTNASAEEKARFLAPGQLETVCLEYLRQEYQHFLQLYSIGENLPPGSELRDIDILGRSHPGGISVVAQVTHERDADELNDKLKKLDGYARSATNARLLFFGPRTGYENPEVEIPETVEYISNGEVFTKLEQLKPALLDAMLTAPQENEIEPPL